MLIGQPLPAEFLADDLPVSLDAALLQRDVPVGLPSDLLTQRPDIRSAEQLLIANNANIGAARAAMFPRFALTASFGSASTDLSQMLSAPNRTWSVIPGVSLPIFDAGRTQANIGVSQANRDIAIAQYEKSIQTAFREVADALTSRSALADQVSALIAQKDSEAARYKLVDARYKGGVSNSLELLDAERSLFAIQQQVIQTRLLSWQTEVNLYKALGGRLDGCRSQALGPVNTINCPANTGQRPSLLLESRTTDRAGLRWQTRVERLGAQPSATSRRTVRAVVGRVEQSHESSGTTSSDTDQRPNTDRPETTAGRGPEAALPVDRACHQFAIQRLP